MTRAVLALLFLIAGGGCTGDDAPACDAPKHTTYSCEPVAAGSAGCVGGPKWSSDYTSTGTAAHQDDPALTFPSLCLAFIPECSPYYMGQAREFRCSGDDSTGYQWGEQL